MIKKVESGQTNTIKKMWYQCFPQEEEKYIEYYFDEIYKPENTVILIENGIVQSSLQRIPHEMMFNNRVIRTSMIVGVATLPQYQKQGNMKKLMQVAIDEIEHQELITCIQAYNPALYEPYGFKMVYNHKETTFTRNHVQKISNEGCSYNVSSEDMLQLYATFVKRFNGYYIRDVKNFNQMKKESAAQGGKILGYYNEKGHLQAYAVCLFTNKEVVMEECIYLNSLALTKLINLALQIRGIVKVHTSEVEDLRILYPGVEVKDYGFTMARVNDFDLFNRLYQVNATTIDEVFASSGRPLYMNEFY
ncbi:GNAT family N-acetyltransferase [Anaerorhabdus sp.]|uniref:GNAT family N-acetyltransferase n=1 Tax=Anaerorhabdus sp. TaxID=1872524 RepID=UPI002FCAD8B7